MVRVKIMELLLKGLFSDCAMNRPTAFVNRKIAPVDDPTQFEIDHSTLSGIVALDSQSEGQE